MSLSDDERYALVIYRIEKANKTLEQVNMTRGKRHIQLILLIAIVIAAVGCAGRKQATTVTDSPYQRKPIVEVTEEELAKDAALIDATVQHNADNRDEAIRLYQELLHKDPNYAPAHYGLGKEYLMIGWLDSALTHTRQAVKLNENSVWYRLQLAQIYERQHDAKNLTATWEEMVKRYPDVVDYYYNLSNAYLMANDVTASIDALNRVEKRFGITEPVSLQKQRLWNAIGKPDKARREIEALADAMPNDIRYNAMLAESYMGEKNYTKALQYYQRIEEYNPQDENIHISLASCYQAMGDLLNTYKHMRTGVMNKNIDCQHRLRFIAEFMMNTQFFAAYSHNCFMLADSVAAECDDEYSHCLPYGQLLAAQERYEEAAKQLERYLENDKSQYMVWDMLIECELRLPNRNQQLAEHAQQASELFPLHLKPYTVLVEYHLQNGDCKNARHYIDRCMMIAPSNNVVKELKQKVEQQCR